MGDDLIKDLKEETTTTTRQVELDMGDPEKPPVDQPFAGPEPKPEHQATSEGVSIFEDTARGSELVINVLDTLQTLGLTRLKRSRVFSIAEWKLIRAKRRNWESSAESSFADDELALFNRYQDYKESVSDLALDDDEFEMLKKPMERVMQEAGVKMSPVTALVAVLALVMLPRIIEIFMKDDE